MQEWEGTHFWKKNTGKHYQTLQKLKQTHLSHRLLYRSIGPMELRVLLSVLIPPLLCDPFLVQTQGKIFCWAVCKAHRKALISIKGAGVVYIFRHQTQQNLFTNISLKASEVSSCWEVAENISRAISLLYTNANTAILFSLQSWGKISKFSCSWLITTIYWVDNTYAMRQLSSYCWPPEELKDICWTGPLIQQ